MRVIRVVVSDLHLTTGIRRGELNPFEDFVYDDRFAELLEYYDAVGGNETDVELILNGDIFDLLKVEIEDKWPLEVTPEIAAEKLRRCLEGHPRFVNAIRKFIERDRRRVIYLPGNHDLDMWFSSCHDMFLRYVAPGRLAEKVRFITSSDTYHLPEGIQILHGHQLERIHRVDYNAMTSKRKDGTEVLKLPWGSRWIIEVLNPAKIERPHVDRVAPLGRFLVASFFLDTRFAIRFYWRVSIYFLRTRIFTIAAWRERIRNMPRIFKEELFALGGYDEAAIRLLSQMRGVHTLIVGHSHQPRYRQLPSKKLLVNTGTWIPMINLDLQHLGQDTGLTYAVIETNDDGQAITSLLRWRGTSQPFEVIPYAE